MLSDVSVYTAIIYVPKLQTFDRNNTWHRAKQFVQLCNSLLKELSEMISQNTKNLRFWYKLNKFLLTWFFYLVNFYIQYLQI
jgi:hypothetical protein